MSWVYQVAPKKAPLLERVLDVAAATLVALFNTDPSFVVVFLFLFVIDLITGMVMDQGHFRFRPLRKLWQSFGYAFRWGMVLVVITTFANAFTATSWVIEVTYLTLSFQMVRSIFDNLTTTESDVREFLQLLWEEMKRRNVSMMEIGDEGEEITDGDGDEAADT